MSVRWAMHRYAFGAGRVALSPEPYRGADPDLGLWRGLALAAQEGSRSGTSLRTLATTTFAALLGAENRPRRDCERAARIATTRAASRS
jgi:hypothetical protein